MALKRLKQERRKFQQQTELDSIIRAEPINDSNLFVWRAVVQGPQGTPYEEGRFNLRIEYSTEYPFKPPKVRFETRIFHPNISRNGSLCVDILHNKWSPVLTTDTILLSIMSLIASPDPDDPMDAESADLYVTNRNKFEQEARKWTERYATKAYDEESLPPKTI